MFLRNWRLFNEAAEGATGGGAAAGATAATAAASTVVVADDGADESKHPWLKPRLERERASTKAAERAALLAEIGVADPAAAKAAVAEAKAAADAKKSAEERALEASQRLTEAQAKLAERDGTIATIAAERMAALTDAQREAVTKVAGIDPGKQINTIAALTPTWSAKPATAKTAAELKAEEDAAKAAAAAAATTAAGKTAPGQTVVSQPDHKAEYKRLKASNPVQAAAYLNKHSDQIYPRA